MIAALLLVLPAPQTVPANESVATDEILVRATRRKCEMRLANHILSDKEFKARAAEWAAGRPVRVVVPAGTSYKCRAKIMFRLNDHGVVRAEFVEGVGGE